METETLTQLLTTDDPRPVHFMGAAGAGMSALAELLARRGVRITGCDVNPGAAAEMARIGVSFSAGHDPLHVDAVRAVVVTAAVQRDHPELERARSLGIPVIRRADALAATVRAAKVIGVAGTHGKTTTTVMVTDALAAAGLDPTGVAGGRVAAWGGHLWRGGDEIIVVEADEYDRSFLALEPAIAIVTNVEADHLDIYADLAEITRTFERFVTPARVIVTCGDDGSACGLRTPNSAEVIRYGISSPDARLVATKVRQDGLAQEFEVKFDGKPLGSVRLNVPGTHNVLNALAAIGCGLALGIELGQMRPGLEGFTGVDRRFQRIAATGGVTIVDDYAHHPTEITATLQAARAAFPGARIVAAFQPHLYSRTRDFAEDFAAALSRADVVFLTGIYAAREAPIPGVTSAVVADALERLGHPPRWTGARTDLPAALAQHTQPGDVILTMGAGDITLSAYALRDMLARERVS
ncbi:MAG TPA: UDP-N-acetylmuramate--L-alanine ligase [Gemmatimonadaceae bacterium]|nr:UDP-N-acetylmuramate--L-alanine ligase [Gemmatimonadaceae bacterium]